MGNNHGFLLPIILLGRGGGAYHTNKGGPPWTVGPLEPPFDVENSQRFNSQLAT